MFVVGCRNEETTEQVSTTKSKPTQESNESDTNDVPSIVEEKSKEKTILYRNEEYEFTLQLPTSWKGKYVVEQIDGSNDIEKIIRFKYKDENAELFSILILKLTKEEWNRDYAGGFIDFVGEKNGKIFASSVPTQIPRELEQNKKEKIHALIDVTKMVNADVPRIIQSFKWFY